MSATTRMLALLTFLGVMVAAPRIADAGDPLAKPSNVEARDRLTAGNRLYRLREFEKAIEEYKAGALKEDVPVFLYNLGQCYRQLGRYDDAIWHYERFLDRGKPTGEIKDAVDGFVKQMKSELEKKAMSQPPIEPAPEPKEAPVTPTSPTTVTVIDPAEPWYSDGLGWGLAGAGVVGAGISVGLFVSASGLDSDANAETRQEVRASLHERASDRRLVGTIVGIAGGAVLITGIIKLVIRPKDRERTVTTSVNLGVTHDGFQVMGRF